MSYNYKTRKDWRKRDWPSGLNDKFAKRLAVKAVRRAKQIINGGLFKKYFERWNINDFK